MIQVKENAQIDRRKDGRTGGRTERPYFIGPFRQLPGVQLNIIQYKSIY